LLTKEEVRSRLREECPPDDDRVPLRADAAPAAVLIALVSSPEGPQVILTRRNERLSNHPGEISFPGGRVEPEDEGPVGAALREASEEIGLPTDRVEVLGCLPPYRTVSNFRVRPVVGWVEPPLEFVLDEREVAEVVLVPLSYVLDSANHQRDALVRNGKARSFYVLPYPGHRIWGATAGMLVILAHTLTAGAGRDAAPAVPVDRSGAGPA